MRVQEKNNIKFEGEAEFLERMKTARGVKRTVAVITESAI